MFGGLDDGSAGFFERSQEIAMQYEQHRQRRRSQIAPAMNFLAGMAAGIMLGRTARRENDGPDSGGTPRGCF